jgi:hypothetical protein
MEMAIDFVKTQSFPGNLVRTFVVDGLMAYGLFLINQGSEHCKNDPKNATNVWKDYHSKETPISPWRNLSCR